MRSATRPIALKRSSPRTCRSSNSIIYGYRKTLDAVLKSMPCFRRFTRSLELSHSKSIQVFDVSILIFSTHSNAQESSESLQEVLSCRRGYPRKSFENTKEKGNGAP